MQRALSRLSDAGILQRRRDGNRVYYRADSDCPILAELSGILTKTCGIAEPLREALAPLAGAIRCAFIHGSIAESRERSESDIDLILIGNASNTDIALALRPLKERLARDVNVTRYAAQEFAAKATAGHPCLSSVLRKPKIFLIGSEDELENLANRETSGAGTDQQART